MGARTLIPAALDRRASRLALIGLQLFALFCGAFFGLAIADLAGEDKQQPVEVPGASELADEGPVRALLEQLKKRDVTTSLSAVRAIREVRATESAAWMLTRDLRHPDSSVRSQAAYGLGMIGSNTKEVKLELIRLLFDTEAPVRKEALVALWHLDGFNDDPETLVCAVQRCLGDRDKTVREAAVSVLGQVCFTPDPLWPDMKAQLILQRIRADDSVVSILIECLAAPEPSISAYAVLALREYGRKARTAAPALLQSLSKALNDQNIGQALRIIDTLGGLGHEAGSLSIETLYALLGKGDALVSLAAAGSLARVDYDKYGAEFRGMLVSVLPSKNVLLRIEAARLMMVLDLRTHDAIMLLREVVLNELVDVTHRRYAVKILSEARICEDRNSLLVAALLQRDLSIGYEATRILGSAEHLPGKVGWALLNYANRLVDEFEDCEHIPPLSLYYLASASGKLGPKGNHMVRFLVGGLKCRESLVRAECISALGRIGPDARAAMPNLRVVLDDPDERVRKCARETMAKLGYRQER